MKTLKSLEIASNTLSLATNAFDIIADELAKNWSLERLQLVSAPLSLESLQIMVRPPCGLRSEPRITIKSQRAINSLCKRNTTKKLIFSPLFTNMTKAKAVDVLETAWALPDNLSLVFWMLTEAPHHFISTPQLPGRKGKKRKRHLQAEDHSDSPVTKDS